MTINELINQVYSLSVAGYFNGEKYSKREFAEYVKGVFRPELGTRRWLMEIALPDGRWYFQMSRYSLAADGFDYYIPETRINEQTLISNFRYFYGR